MCFIVDFPTDLLTLILSEWIPISELTLVDTAFCNNYQRSQFHNVIAIRNFTNENKYVLIGVSVSAINLEMLRYIMFITHDANVKNIFNLINSMEDWLGSGNLKNVACICKNSLISEFESSVTMTHDSSSFFTKSFLFWNGTTCIQRISYGTTQRTGYYFGRCVVKDGNVFREGEGSLETYYENLYLHLFQGHFRNSLKEGRGNLIIANGTRLRGSWIKDKIDGQCTIVDKFYNEKNSNFENGFEILY
jgi:hypothetical protein